ncbi:MAG: SocA family protein [Spirulinaceae cyanobacterium RM2_2_10]|nr:SocA family protein [Spirulinaceae cyanobacterium SM2_1_0]NJO19817.1 SocA family protein [Spirulinaceae cyanobacterium RM2_2_10]
MATIKFQFDPNKVVQSAALLLKRHGKPMSYLGLLKMLYIADRRSLECSDQPITGDRYVAMEYGPVLSGVYDLIKDKEIGVRGAQSLWAEYIERCPNPEKPKAKKDYALHLLQDPGDDDLCDQDVAILEEVYQEFGSLDPFKVVDWTHDLPEWEDPREKKLKVTDIYVDTLLELLGRSPEEIEEIYQDTIRERYLDEVLSG